MNENLHRVIGIDLGTTYSAVAVYDTYLEQSIVIKDKSDGDSPTTPSVVSLDRRLNKAIVGSAAKRNLPLDEENTILEIKREMGEEFSPETLDHFNAHPTFKVGEPVKARFAGQWYSPQEVSAFILMKMKEIAEAEIGEEIRDAVVTVPAYFTEKQKKATREAAKLAGLYPLQLIPEPTAAAICYGVDKFDDAKKIYLVFDLGGGTFDVSIIDVEGNKIDVIATSGDPRLGGGDFDDLITHWVVQELLNEFKIDVRENRAAKAQIKFKSEQAKIILSNHQSTTITLPELNPEKPPILILTREIFLSLIEKILKKSISYVEIALNAARDKKGVERDQINAILLVGGSTKIPKVKTMLLDYFGQDESFIRSELNPDEVVARGAAILAFRYNPSPPPFDITRDDSFVLMNTEAIDQPVVNLITEHSLGIEIQDKMFSKIIDQGSNIPIEIRRGGFVNAGPTEKILVNIFQGESEYVYENTLIGSLELGPMKPEQAGFHQFEVIFKLDQNGLLQATVHHINEGKTYEGKYDHKTGVGGDKALEAMRNKLLLKYAKRSELQELEKVIEPPTPPPSPDAMETSEDFRKTSETVTPSQQPANDQVGAKQKAETGTVSPNDFPELNVDVSEDYKSLIRRAKKQYFKMPDETLFKHLKDLVSALNEKKTSDEVADLYDDLEDSLIQAKNR